MLVWQLSSPDSRISQKAVWVCPLTVSLPSDRSAFTLTSYTTVVTALRQKPVGVQSSLPELRKSIDLHVPCYLVDNNHTNWFLWSELKFSVSSNFILVSTVLTELTLLTHWQFWFISSYCFFCDKKWKRFLDKFVICNNNNDPVVIIMRLIFIQSLIIALKRKQCSSYPESRIWLFWYCYNYDHAFTTNLAFFVATGPQIFQVLARKNLQPYWWCCCWQHTY